MNPREKKQNGPQENPENPSRRRKGESPAEGISPLSPSLPSHPSLSLTYSYPAIHMGTMSGQGGVSLNGDIPCVLSNSKSLSILQTGPMRTDPNPVELRAHPSQRAPSRALNQSKKAIRR